ncbi:hypothetical protein HUJ04_011476 [Dendroctonus ponderosae]|nr:hypothetical protein HUJ04_011476 [Dendroctonus ponderosae]
MSAYVMGITSAGGLPVFSRKKGNCKSVSLVCSQSCSPFGGLFLLCSSPLQIRVSKWGPLGSKEYHKCHAVKVSINILCVYSSTTSTHAMRLISKTTLGMLERARPLSVGRTVGWRRMKKEIRPENIHRRCWWQQHPVIKRKLGIIVMVAVVSRLKNTGKAAKMRRNVKIMLAFTVVWMFVIIYYLPRVADDGSKPAGLEISGKRPDFANIPKLSGFSEQALAHLMQ